MPMFFLTESDMLKLAAVLLFGVLCWFGTQGPKCPVCGCRAWHEHWGAYWQCRLCGAFYDVLRKKLRGY